jgi:hypothetical protein
MQIIRNSGNYGLLPVEDILSVMSLTCLVSLAAGVSVSFICLLLEIYNSQRKREEQRLLQGYRFIPGNPGRQRNLIFGSLFTLKKRFRRVGRPNGLLKTEFDLTIM